jgi:hypothetical protein
VQFFCLQFENIKVNQLTENRKAGGSIVQNEPEKPTLAIICRSGNRMTKSTFSKIASSLTDYSNQGENFLKQFSPR